MTNFIDRHIGKKIRDIRLARKLAPGALANAAGVSASDLEEYENGNARLPAREMMALTDFLQVDVKSFFNGLPLGDPENRACPDPSHAMP